MIIGNKINASMFTYYKDQREFVQEISSLGFGGNGITSQLFDDACDEGFVMVSDKTGVEVPFYLANVEKSDEGEILCWNFKVVANRYKTALKGLTVIVFND